MARLRRDLRVVSSVGHAVVISRNGHKRPCWPSVRSYRIGYRGVGRFTVEILFSIVGVCEVIPRVRAPLFNDAALVLNQYLRGVLDPIPNVFFFCWYHQSFINPSINLYLPDGVHMNNVGQYSLYRSYRGAIIKALRILPAFSSSS